MLIQPDSKELGDKRLNPEESVAKLREENLQQAAKYKINGQSELEDETRSAGPRIAWQELIRRLSLCSPQLKFREGAPGNIAIYALKTPAERIEDGYDPSRTDFFNDHKYVGGFPKEPLPEFSHVTVDERGLPKREIRGWRSVLIALIKADAITYRAAVRWFGEPTGQRSVRWHEQLQSFKN